MPLVDVSLYVMTPEFGAASQLEKIDMLDFADFVAINKFDRKGAQDALRDVRKQYQRNRERFEDAAGRRCRCSARWRRASTTTASPRSTRRSPPSSSSKGLKLAPGTLPPVDDAMQSTAQNAIVPPARVRYLAEIAETVRDYHAVGATAGADRARAPAAARGDGDARRPHARNARRSAPRRGRRRDPARRSTR